MLSRLGVIHSVLFKGLHGEVTVNVWIRFWLAQLIQLAFYVLGLVLLIVPCILQAWEPSPDPSIKDQRTIDRWRWPWLRWLGYHNAEDGDSGQTALVWKDGQPVTYANPNWPRWSAYKWSALRNSADGWKYRLAFDGPLITFRVFAWTVKAGYQLENGRKVPVLSA